MRVLHLEDDPDDAIIIQLDMQRLGAHATFVSARSRDEFAQALREGTYAAMIVDNCVPGLRAPHAIALAKSAHPQVPVIVCSGAARESDVAESFAAGASDYVLKDQAWQLAAALRRIAAGPAVSAAEPPCPAMLQLVEAAQKLSMARRLDMIIDIVPRTARESTGADGAAFVLRDGKQCHYIDEDAIAPLWKGQRFALDTCISGWAMLHGESAVISDIYQDQRLAHAAYRPTFVQSLAMVPIRAAAPIGAIGVYWGRRHECAREHLQLLEALASTTAVAMENLTVHENLEHQLRQCTARLEGANQQLAASVSECHELQATLRAIHATLEDAGAQGDVLQPADVAELRRSAHRMSTRLDDLLRQAQLDPAQPVLHPEQRAAKAIESKRLFF